MGGFHLNEEYIRKALHTAAYSCDPPEDLKQQIDARLAWQEKKEVIHMKKISMKKAAAAAVLACALTGTVCMAAEKISSLYYVGSSSECDTVTDFADIAKLEKKANVKTGALEVFRNGFAFENADMIEVHAADAEGNQAGSSQTEIMIVYKNGDKYVNYAVEEENTKFTGEEYADKQAIESDGVTYYYSQSNYLFVPEGYEPTAEEKEAQESEKLFISEGSDKREEKVCESLSWNADGQTYTLLGMDLDMSAEELLDMAKQMK